MIPKRLGPFQAWLIACTQPKMMHVSITLRLLWWIINLLWKREKNQREKIFPRTFFYFQVQWNDVDGGYGKHFFEFNHDISTAAIPQKPPVLKPLRHRVWFLLNSIWCNFAKKWKLATIIQCCDSIWLWYYCVCGIAANKNVQNSF